MGDSASTDTVPADVAEVRRASGITIAPEAALHRALQERTDELERVRVEWHTETLRLRGRIREVEDERDEALGRLENVEYAVAYEHAAVIDTLRRERDEARAEVARREAESREGYDLLAQITTPTAPDVGSTTSAPAAGAADPQRGRTPDEIRAWSVGLFGG